MAAKRIAATQGDARATVLLLGGSEGGMIGPGRPLPRALLANGYDVATLATFNHPGLPEAGVRVPLDAIASKARSLQGRSNGCVAFIGISRGSEAALLMASFAPRTFDATVAVVPAHVSGPAPGPNLFNQPAWAWKGRDVPFLPTRALSEHGVRWLFSSGDGRRQANHAIKLDSIRSQPERAERARIPVERIERPLLLLSALHDDVWPSRMMADKIEASTRVAGKGGLVRHVSVDSDHLAAEHPRGVETILRFLNRQFEGAAACRHR